MKTLLSIVLTFLLSGLIGNFLLQKWQARSWLAQQRFLGHEKEFVALKELTDEIATLLGIRIFHTQRLNWSLSSGDKERRAQRVSDYDDAVKRWNERLTSFYVRLPMLANHHFATTLESDIQNPLVAIGRQIERAASDTGEAVAETQSSIDKNLNSIQGRAISFNKSLLRYVEKRKSEVYFGTIIHFTPTTLSRFSTWHLVKALFVPDVETMSVVRTSLDT